MRNAMGQPEFLATWLIPFCAFLSTTLLYTYGFLDKPFVCVLVTVIGVVVSVNMFFAPRANLGGSLVFNPNVGLICIMSFVLGSVVGLFLYDSYQIFPQFYNRAGQYTNVVPSQSSASVADAGKLVFSNEAYVDTTQSIGFIRETGDVYCVAPIRDGSGIERMQFWAAGIGCCGAQGSFTCDAVKDSNAHAGIVVFDNNGFFQEARRDYYDKARKKAEAEYGLQSVSTPIFVRWVKTGDLDKLSWSYGFKAVCHLFLWNLCYLALSATFAHVLFAPR